MSEPDFVDETCTTAVPTPYESNSRGRGAAWAFLYISFLSSRLCNSLWILMVEDVALGIIGIDGQVHLVRLQTDNFRLFLRKQTDK